MKKVRLKDYSLTCLERFQIQEDAIETVRATALAFTSVIEDALDCGVPGKDLAAAMEPMLRIIKRAS